MDLVVSDITVHYDVIVTSKITQFCEVALRYCTICFSAEQPRCSCESRDSGDKILQTDLFTLFPLDKIFEGALKMGGVCDRV